MTTGQRIKKLRNNLAYTQKQLAHLVELSVPELSLIENDKRTPSATVLCLLADTLYTTTDYLMCRTDNPDFIMNPSIPDNLRKQIEFVIRKYYSNKEKRD